MAYQDSENLNKFMKRILNIQVLNLKIFKFVKINKKKKNFLNIQQNMDKNFQNFKIEMT